MTAQEVYEYALALLDELESDGSVLSDTDDSYGFRAIPLINILQREIALAEGVTPNKITSLADVLRISDDSAIRILPYGLAAKFAISDDNQALYTQYQSEYNTLLRTISAVEKPIVDKMNILSGF